jgi:hypothetical protein
MTLFETIITTSVSTASIIGVIIWLARNLIQERLRGAIKHEYDTKLEAFQSELRRANEIELTQFRTQLERESGQDLALLQKDLDLLKQKEFSGHQEKLNAYRHVFEDFSEIYSDLQVAFIQGSFEQVRDKYNRFWVRSYNQLSMMAPQDVMDAFDALNDYMIRLLTGRQAVQPWPETRKLALTFINCMRKDIGLANGEIKYHGSL